MHNLFSITTNSYSKQSIIFLLTKMTDSQINTSLKKRRKLSPAPTEPGQSNWRTETNQLTYSSKLITALQHSQSSRATPRAVRETADRVLAVSAKGRTRWSRAILTGRLSLRLSKINRTHKKAAKPGIKKPVVREKLGPVEKKVKVLGGLVPGCRKVGLPSLLEETIDYVAALEMQVKALTFLTGLLNGERDQVSGVDLLDSSLS